jgi:hypothetical protein
VATWAAIIRNLMPTIYPPSAPAPLSLQNRRRNASTGLSPAPDLGVEASSGSVGGCSRYAGSSGVGIGDSWWLEDHRRFHGCLASFRGCQHVFNARRGAYLLQSLLRGLLSPCSLYEGLSILPVALAYAIAASTAGAHGAHLTS